MEYTELENYCKIKYVNLDNELIAPEYERLYSDISDIISSFAVKVFAYWHKRVNNSFEILNSYINEGRTYLHADTSRNILSTINEFKEFSKKIANFKIKTIESYLNYMDNCIEFIKPFNGSTIPDDFPQIELLYSPIFIIQNIKSNNSYMSNKKMIGSGAYATVYKYDDINYKTKFAYKKLNKNATDKEKARFYQEFNIMKNNEYPYILKVYSYFEKQQMYIMEYMDYNLKTYINKRNTQLDFKSRKAIVLQILKGIIYIHSKGILHRDLSYNNILIKDYEDIVVVKICDFGLAKDKNNQITSKLTSIKGTYIDPSLERFEDYNIKNEIFALGNIIWFVFTGKSGYKKDSSLISEIVEKCIIPDTNSRYNDVKELYNEVMSLKGPNERGSNTSADIKETKEKIITYISNYSANNVPSVCEALGLPPGDISEAFKSKVSYISKRLYALDSKRTNNIILKIKEQFGDDI